MCVLQTGNERLLSQCKIPFPDTLLHLVQIRFQTLSKQHRHNKIARHRQNRILLQIKNLSRRPFYYKTHIKLSVQAVNRVLLGNKANNAAASEGEEATVETVEAVAVEATDSCCQAKDSCATACDKKADCTEKKECCDKK